LVKLKKENEIKMMGFYLISNSKFWGSLDGDSTDNGKLRDFLQKARLKITLRANSLFFSLITRLFCKKHSYVFC